MSGPLSGLRVVELAGIGPGPFACMMLADHGAEVIRIERPGADAAAIDAMRRDIALRSRNIVEADLKSAEGRAVAIDLMRSADAVVESFRPGVAERLALGPDDARKLNPRLVYGRVTGWGRGGPYADMAGHDINYMALSGALHCFGRAGGKPTPPLNVVGTFGGAAMLAFGMVAAMIHAARTGEGQVVDCATTDASALLVSVVRTLMAQGEWEDERGINMLDTGAPFYECYETSDGKHVAIGAVEPQFYARLLKAIGVDENGLPPQFDKSGWEALKRQFEEVFRTRTRAEWCDLLERADVCFAPVLSMVEAASHPHNIARDRFVTAGGVVQSRPVPQYSRTPTTEPRMWAGSYRDAHHLWGAEDNEGKTMQSDDAARSPHGRRATGMMP